MNFVTPDFAPALPEIVLAAGLCLVLLVDLFLPPRLRDVTYFLSLAVLGATALAVADPYAAGQVFTFSGSFVDDPLARLLKLVAVPMVATVFLYSRAYLNLRDIYRGEFYLLGLFALLGIMVMISAASLLTMYLGLEMLSLALYALVAFDRESPVAAESAMKYFVLGAIASGTMLYGISLIYGVTGTLLLAEIGDALMAQAGVSQLALLFGLAFIVVGIAFKFGAVPFHMWLPDVYQGSPTCVTLFIGTVPKLAAVAMAIRILVEGFGAMAPSWEGMLAILAVLSLGIGNVVAIAQKNIKRMLAYSTIGHVGFIFLGLIAGSREGLEAAVFYTVVYVIMAAGAFGVLILLCRDGHEAEELDHFRGLNQRSPLFAAVMLLLMVSMVGVPPLAGFFAKWAVLSALVDAGHVGLAVAAVLFSVIGAFYYLRVLKLMYFDAPQDTTPIEAAPDLRLVLALNGAAVLALGLFPRPLLELCAAAIG